jgi:hypothetical protein
MNEEHESICPLCERAVPQRQLYPYFELDPARSHHNTIEVIKAFHPDWVEEQGVCQDCWKSYSEASRVINSLRFQRTA